MATVETAIPLNQEIDKLASIDRDVAKLLRSAGLAIQALTLNESSTNQDSACTANHDARKSDFTSAAASYFEILSAIDVELRRQINSLEKADIIPRGLDTSTTQQSSAPLGAACDPSSTNSGTQHTTRQNAITGNGLGNLEIGWLNSRNDDLGQENEARLWSQTRDMLQTLGGSTKTVLTESPHGRDVQPGSLSAGQTAGDTVMSND